VVGEVGAADRVRRLSLRAGRYFVRGRGSDVLLEGALQLWPGVTAQLDESTLSRTDYARLVRKGEGVRTSVTSLEAQARMRTSLSNSTGVCPGAAAGVSVALRSVTLTSRLAWCRSGFNTPGLIATLDQYDLELSATHVWDFRALSLEVGLTVGGAVFHQSFQTTGLAPPRITGALQISPTVAISRDLGARAYIFLSASGATYLFRSEDSASGRSTFGPSFAVLVALGLGYRF
jgi:hypothetical protein